MMRHKNVILGPWKKAKEALLFGHLCSRSSLSVVAFNEGLQEQKLSVENYTHLSLFKHSFILFILYVRRLIRVIRLNL